MKFRENDFRSNMMGNIRQHLSWRSVRSVVLLYTKLLLYQWLTVEPYIQPNIRYDKYWVYKIAFFKLLKMLVSANITYNFCVDAINIKNSMSTPLALHYLRWCHQHWVLALAKKLWIYTSNQSSKPNITFCIIT